MKAIGYYENLPSSDPKSLVDLDLPKPSPTGRDILVEVKAISVNPVDTKIRQGRAASNGQPEVLGWDATGVVAAIGPEVTGYAPGDKVWYAGDISRPGTNSEFHLVDERIVGRMPETLGFSAAAALPLTALTAYEMLFDRLKVTEPVAGGAKAALIIGGSGGVGSIAIQLLRALSDVSVIATASRPETQAWVKELGAHHVVDHSQPLAKQVAALGIGAPSFVFSTTHSDSYISEVTSLVAPQGRYGLIDDPAAFDIMPFKGKSISIHWELMYTRSLFQTADITRQQDILNEVAALVDAGKVRTTTDQPLGLITAENLRKAHGMLESNKTKGKLVLEGFPG
ncbi:Zinc-type alcohol dehydrogenase-like protein [Pelagimonas phthalicica]|uniref:Zinc-type alcohol dehydrogenase-like protein n=1 Tax=Pelagimonas phthalicica TaxID=1037362 RepID=A0A238JJW6_9RHOB|nr:zinc-binding alcohol dehydrogenase family protein [Pelagimonas phthalicica]TDS88418.1 zinc-binding alcohol dehydrogenase family protein [Pelagimonas phthalicica]SMX30504.1 Zinc-type alcohol dehydrogenase-like protein [Pelagimonas phthalicica]